MKRITYLLAALISVFAISLEVKAITDVECITGEQNQKCTLSGDIEATAQLVVQSEIELDLNGHVIRPADGVTGTTGIIGVKRGAKLTIEDSVGTGKITAGTGFYGAVQLVIPSEGKGTGKVATLIVNSGTLEGYYYAIVGNGDRHNTSITINGGTLTMTAIDPSTNKLDGAGIYHPQEGTLIINGGSISGGTGIEMRSGTLIVNGGVIEGFAVPTSVTPNGNGTTTTGSGIAIAQHTTKKDINVKIKGGTIRGYSAVYESNPQNNANVANQVSLSITGGSFEATNGGETVVYSEDITNFIVRGTFNKQVNSNYILNTAEVKQLNENYIIGSENGVGIGDESNSVTDYDIDTTYKSHSYLAPVESYDIDLSWDDMHWVFVYEGNANDPSRKVWITEEDYNTIIENEDQLTANEINGNILDGISNLSDPDIGITIVNNSNFAVDVLASIEQKTNQEYTSASGLKIAIDTQNKEYSTSVQIDELLVNSHIDLLVRPTSTRYVNDNGSTATVTGEIKLTFAKYTNS